MASVALMLFLLGVGGAFAFRGWWIYESFIMAVGFLVGLIIGVGFVTVADVQGLMGLIMIFGAGMLGASLAMLAEILAVALTGYVFGAAVGSVVPGVTFGDWTNPIILLTGFGGALLAWLVHKFVIILLTAFIGSIFISKTLVAWPDLGLWVFVRADAFSGWFFLAFLTGIAAQIGMLEREEDESIFPEWYRSDTVEEIANIPCPSCERYVEPQWSRCRYCGEDIEGLALPSTDEERGSSRSTLSGPGSATEGDRCDNCNRIVGRGWNNCQYCGTSLSIG